VHGLRVEAELLMEVMMTSGSGISAAVAPLHCLPTVEYNQGCQIFFGTTYKNRKIY
jgi:hypothetical protein